MPSACLKCSALTFGQEYTFPSGNTDKNNNLIQLKDFLKASKWNLVYDFIEHYIECLDEEADKKEVETDYNRVLEEEKSGYRVIEGIVTPIINDVEMKSIKTSMTTDFEAVNIHFEKALKNYSKRQNPDYENSIKGIY